MDLWVVQGLETYVSLSFFLVYLKSLSVSLIIYRPTIGWQCLMKWQERENKRYLSNFRYCTGIWIEGPRKATKYLSLEHRLVLTAVIPAVIRTIYIGKVK
jgi:hypothetical protein